MDMKSSKMIRSLFLVGSTLCFGGTGCAIDAQPSGEEVSSAEQSYTIVPGDKAFAYSQSAVGTAPSQPEFSFNSGGGAMTISNIGLGQGQYRVDIPNLGATVGGHVQVMSRLDNSDRCKVHHWESVGSTLQVFVNCFNAAGGMANSLFALNYVRRSDVPGPQAAYVWAHDPSTTLYDATSAYSWNSTGAPITISHQPGTGTYSVFLPGQDLSGGTVEVTAYGDGNQHCKVASWGNGLVNVACFHGTTGAPAESRFTMLFSRKSPNGTPSSSYAWAEQPTTPYYNPQASYQLGLLNTASSPEPSVVSTPISVTRLGVGRYSVLFPAMASFARFPANVKVTAYGTGSEVCKATSWGQGTGSDATATVRCFTATGLPVDTRYTITYSSFALTNG
jgi:hypothetical protein